MPLRLSTLAPGVHLVRVLVGDGPEYDRMIVVTELDDGRVLFLQGWVGRPLSPREWRDAALRRFPRARWVVFRRVRGERDRLVVLGLVDARGQLTSDDGPALMAQGEYLP